MAPGFPSPSEDDNLGLLPDLGKASTHPDVDPVWIRRKMHNKFKIMHPVLVYEFQSDKMTIQQSVL